MIDNIVTYYPSTAYQIKTDGTYTNTRKYYSFSGSVVAMSENGNVTWLLQDQVSSTTITANSDGSMASEVRYSAFGGIRASTGTTVTDKKYTGQQQESEIGLDYYVARFYDPTTAHFIQMDSIVPDPGDSKVFDRYAYANNNPIRFNDPTGHRFTDLMKDPGEKKIIKDMYKNNAESLARSQTVSRRAQKYGITLVNFSAGDALRVLNALDRMNSALGGGIEKFTKGTTYTFEFNPNNYGGDTSVNGDILFHSYKGGLPYQNIYHEIAHSINYRSNNYFVDLLNSKKDLSVDGIYVMGGPNSTYQRNSLGYTKSTVSDPSGRDDIDAQQHPGNYPCAKNDEWCAAGNTADEEWADLIANYVAGNFNSKPEGIARNEWVEKAWKSYPNN